MKCINVSNDLTLIMTKMSKTSFCVSGRTDKLTRDDTRSTAAVPGRDSSLCQQTEKMVTDMERYLLI